MRLEKKEVSYMLVPGSAVLIIQKLQKDVTERWLLASNKNKQITYYILYILIANSVLIFLTIAQICYQQISILIRCY